MSDKHFLVETYDLMEKLDHGINNHHLHLEQQLSQKECPLRPSAFTKLTGEDNLLTLPLPSVDPPHEEPGRVCLPAKHEKLVGSTIHPVTLRQRKKLLREAGVSKIDAVEEAEAREIRISRTLCGCNCKVRVYHGFWFFIEGCHLFEMVSFFSFGSQSRLPGPSLSISAAVGNILL